jgi:fido (protein-threonine AMPylation protein)
MPTPWDDDPPGSAARIEANLLAVGRRIYAGASRREPPSVGMAQQWHRDVFDGVTLPADYYAGEVRDSDSRFPELFGYEVGIGTQPGVPSAQVPAALADFEARAQRAVLGPDGAIAVGTRPTAPVALNAVILLAANLHGEWVRIHPFANGNGRTARLWVIWTAARYGLPPFVRLRPRPAGIAYAAAAHASMAGEHGLMATVLNQMLHEYLANPPR